MNRDETSRGRWFIRVIRPFEWNRINRRRFVRCRYQRTATVGWREDLSGNWGVHQVKVSDISRGGVRMVVTGIRREGERGVVLLRMNEHEGLLCGVVVLQVVALNGLFSELRCRFSEVDPRLLGAIVVEGARMRTRSVGDRA